MQTTKTLNSNVNTNLAEHFSNDLLLEIMSYLYIRDLIHFNRVNK